MSTQTKQAKFWSGTFAKGYLRRNLFDSKELDRDYVATYGVTRTSLNKEFLKSIPKNARILEVGSNVGNILLSLQKLGYKNLYGIELNPKIVELARRRLSGIHIIQGDALDIPFKDNFFDLVFTSDVLIHIAPHNIKKALQEIGRCTKKYIWGFEYYAPTYTEIPYRGNRNVLWKTDFPALYFSMFGKTMKLVKKKFYPWVGAPHLLDCMFLLRKM